MGRTRRIESKAIDLHGQLHEHSGAELTNQTATSARVASCPSPMLASVSSSPKSVARP